MLAISLCYIYIYIQVLPDEGFPAQKHIFYLCLPMVFMYSFGSVSFGVGLKGKEGHAFGPSTNNQINIYYLYIFHYAYDSSPDEVLPKTSTMVFICILGSVPFGVGLKGKEGHAFGPSKNKQNNIFYLEIFHYAYDSSPDEVLPKTSILTVRPHGVHAYFGLGTVWGRAKGKGRPRFWTLKE